MDPAHIGGDMSPLYVPRKRKPVQSQARSSPPCPAVQRFPDRQGELNTFEYPEDEETQDQNDVKMKRTCSKKRYEDLQNVSLGSVDYPTTSCSVMSSGGLANGSDERSINMPPREMGKDQWPDGPEASREQPQPEEQTWSSSRERGPEPWTPGREEPQTWIPDRDGGHPGPDQAWITSQEQGPESGWGVGRNQSQDQAWNSGRDPGTDGSSGGPERRWGNGRSQDEQVWSDSNRERGNIWRPDLNMKKVQRAEVEPSPAVNNFLPPPEGSMSYAVSVSRSSTVQMNEDQKPILLPIKKEPPTYPPGSQEERWQLQIVAKGRVTCPKCKSVSRKTVEGLKKHMENCRLQPFICQHCGKQLKSSTGMKYHIMADHSNLPSADDTKGLDDRAIKDKLRKILKRLGKLKCSKEGCTAAFTSIMGYVYHMKKCGKEESELEKLLLNCSHCGKAYKSKAGLEYHLKSEHAPTSTRSFQTPQKPEEDEALKAHREANPERTPSGRVQRASAQVANFHLAEIANNELPKDWPKRKFQSDLVPDDKKLKYARPGLPAFSQEVLRKWKNEVKLQRKVHCPNQGCDCTYTSVSGLKAHLGLCTKGEFEAGKYRCLICNKEFNSESGVKYHINSVHSQDWFVTNKKASKKFEKFLKNQPKESVHANKQTVDQYHFHHLHQQQHHHYHHHHHHHHHHQQPLQHPLQPLHHLQHQTQFLHAEQQNLHSQDEPELHYTSLEPPAGPVWLDMDRKEAVLGPEHIDMHMVDVIKSEENSDEIMEVNGRIKGETIGETGMVDGKQTDCFGFGSSEVEAGLHGTQRQIDQWNLKQPDIMEPHADAAK
ncbi:uncharacterized protein LOC106963073 isoform X3 [Poecilia latipinna]|uniref:uncharacterized protein LOC106963073 isoform X3 n=1 Tax=Poecilia latipinna TaxID=48699 RepID=UPI00072E584B|nr:PREDICTED: uncharacterized protein LOC106963073 isoform X3 [Poecilia latipinna]